MFRKILATVLCALLLLAMPLSSLAATDVTVRIVPGADLAALHEMVPLVLDNLFLRIVAEDESAQLSLESQKGEILSAAIRADENGFYAASPLLGNRVMYFSAEDLSAYAVQLMKQSGADEATIAQFEQMLGTAVAPAATAAPASGSFMSSVISANAGIAATTTTAVQPTTQEDYQAMLNDDPALQQFTKRMEEKMVVTEGTFEDPAFDTATTMTQVTMTGDDVLILLDSQVIQQFYASLAQSAGMTVEELTAQVKDAFSQLDLKYDVLMYTNGDELCSMQMVITMKGDVVMEVATDAGKTTTETTTVDMEMDMTVNAKTEGDVENLDVVVAMADNTQNNSIGFDMTIAEDDENDTLDFQGRLTEGMDELMLFQGSFTEGEDDAIRGWFGLLADGGQMSLTLDGKETNDVYDAALSLYFRDDATAMVEPTWSDKPLVSLALQVKDVETPALMNTLNAATPTSSVQLLKMDAKQMQTELSAIAGDALSAFLTGMGNLPSELLSLVTMLLPQ